MDICNPANQNNQDSITKFDECTTRVVILNPNAPTIVLQPNPNRISVLIVNLSDHLVSLVCGDSPAIVNKGLPLRRQDSEFTIKKGELFTGKVTAISNKAAELVVMECNQ